MANNNNTRRFNVHACSKGRIRVSVNALIFIEPGTLMKEEADAMKNLLADEIMQSVARLRFLNVPLSKVKVTR